MLTIICDTPGKPSAVEREKPKRGGGEATLRPRCTRTRGTDMHMFSGNQPCLFYLRVMGHEVG
jgi:threonine dehydrogenase-like Zn-dependent dehydrogenase